MPRDGNVSLKVDIYSCALTFLSPTVNKGVVAVFTREDYFLKHEIRFTFPADLTSCFQGVVHTCTTQDSSYRGLSVRLWVDHPTDPVVVNNQHQEVEEWVPEEILEFEEQGPQMDVAPLERSRSAFPFLHHDDEFHCRRLSPIKLQCVLALGTPQETPFYVLDPVNGLDEDGWNGFPVVFIMGGAHGNECAGSASAMHLVKDLSPPKRGRIVILPFANMRALKAGHRFTKTEGDVNRNFPSGQLPIGHVALSIWSLMLSIRPDVFLDLHEGWGFHFKTKSLAKTSKGSSIIASPDAQLLARFALNRLPQEVDVLVAFDLIVPPIAGGLASKLNAAFHTRSLVVETTKTDQPLRVRVKQQLSVVYSVLVGLHLSSSMPPVFSSSLDCVHMVRYGQAVEDSQCLSEKDGVIHF